jgi:hypothetical protein
MCFVCYYFEWQSRQICVVASNKAQELRDLLSLARKLRQFAGQTHDAHYVGLFLDTAETLENRARAMADSAQPLSPLKHIDLTC